MAFRIDLRRISACGIYLGFALGGTLAFGQGAVVLDGSFGTSGALAGPNFQIPASVGQQIGPNLFHSFGTFNLVNGESATFSGPAGIQNILARVTGGSPSSIDGTITSSIAGANLFLLNPSGVMFGPNAQVNVTGAFVTGTPDYVKLAGGGVFFTSLGGADNLTSAPISAFGFLAAAPAPVTFDGSTLSVGTGIHVLGGDITVDNGATLFQSTGRLTLFSAASAGEVPFSIATAGAGYSSATNPRFGNITVRNNSAVAMASVTGGKIVIRGGRLTLDNGFLTAAGGGAGPGPDISVQAHQVAIQNGGTIKSASFASGPAGAIQVQADSIAIQGNGASIKGIVGQSFDTGAGADITIIVTGGLDLSSTAVIGEAAAGTGPDGNVNIQAGSVSIDDSGISLAAADAGNAGSLTMNVTGALTLTGFGFIDATAFSSGNAGDISVHAGSLTIDGTTTFANLNPGIFSQSQASGNAGNVMVTVEGALVVKAGGQIDSSAFVDGQGGNVSVHAGSLTLLGSDVPGFATQISSTSTTGATGNAGSVSVDVTGILSITNAGSITGTTRSAGNGGDLHVHAGTLVIDGSASPSAFTGIVATANFGSTGNAGSLTVNVDGATTVSGRGEIASGTFSSGHSGNVTVNSGALTILGANGVGNPSGIFAQTGGTGNAGTVTVNVAGALGIIGFGAIDTSTFSSGLAGDVIVRAQTVTLDASNAPARLSGILSSATFGSSAPAGSVNVGVAGSLTLANGAVISSASNGTGPGGSVVVAANDISLLGPSSISASAVLADAGTVGVTANTLSLIGGSSISTSAGANGGNITLTVGQLLYLLESQITAQAGLNGGNINIGINPQFVVLNRSLISANAALGQGGNITITSTDFLNTNTAITATGTTNGTIIISSPDLDLSGSLTPLPANLVSDQDRLREKCARAVNHEFSTFIVVGRGGTEAAP